MWVHVNTDASRFMIHGVVVVPLIVLTDYLSFISFNICLLCNLSINDCYCIHKQNFDFIPNMHLHELVSHFPLICNACYHTADKNAVEPSGERSEIFCTPYYCYSKITCWPPEYHVYTNHPHVSVSFFFFRTKSLSQNRFPHSVCYYYFECDSL